MGTPTATSADFLRSDPAQWPMRECNICGASVRWPPFRTTGAVLCQRCCELHHPNEESQETVLTPSVRLARAGCPPRYRMLSRKSWEALYRPWEEGRLTTAHGDGRSEECLSLAEILEAWTAGNPIDNWLLFLFGASGRGKTGLGTAMMAEHLAGKTLAWLDAEDWVDSMQAEFAGGRWVPVYRKACEPDVVMMDDVASVRGDRIEAAGGNWGAERVALALRSRERELKRTIVTSNMLEAADMGAINPSLVSRILGCRLVFKIEGPDRRTAPMTAGPG